MWEGEECSTGDLPAVGPQKCVFPFPRRAFQNFYGPHVPGSQRDIKGRILSFSLLYLRHWCGLS